MLVIILWCWEWSKIRLFGHPKVWITNFSSFWTSSLFSKVVPLDFLVTEKFLHDTFHKNFKRNRHFCILKGKGDPSMQWKFLNHWIYRILWFSGSPNTIRVEKKLFSKDGHEWIKRFLKKLEHVFWGYLKKSTFWWGSIRIHDKQVFGHLEVMNCIEIHRFFFYI